MGSIQITSAGERMQFENAKKNIQSALNLSNTAMANAVLTQSYLRCIQPLTPNNTGTSSTGTNFKFPILNNQQGSGLPARPDELRLTLQNAFYMSKIYFYLFNTGNAAGMNVQPKTYPNPIAFPNGYTNLWTVYNGYCRITINMNIQMPYYPMSKFLYVPATQATAAPGSASPLDAYDGTLIQPFEPNLVLAGNYDNELEIMLPAAVGTVDQYTQMAFEIEGVLAQNVALGAYSPAAAYQS